MVQWAPRTNQEIKIRKIGLIFPSRINHLEIRLHKKRQDIVRPHLVPLSCPLLILL